MTHTDVIKALKKQANPEKAAFFPRFFKTGKGEYGEGDVFLGITVPQTRSVAKEFRTLPLLEIAKLLAHKIHEVRLAGLEILVMQYERGDEKIKKQVVDFYLKHLDGVNNWDLVDGSAPYILGHWLRTHDRSILMKLARSKNLWEQRIAVVATQSLINVVQFDNTLELAEFLLKHPHDLMHKAIGWMLREIGKKDERVLKKFLDKHAHEMPRTMLRYAIEKFGRSSRLHYMRMKSI